MSKYSVRKYPETELKGGSIKNTGKTRIVTSYTTWKESTAHKTPSGAKFLGTDVSVEGPKNKPVIVYRVFEVSDKPKRKTRRPTKRRKK